MKIVFSSQSWADYLYWHETDQDVVKRINLLISDAMRHPFQGIGRPEPLRNELSGWWSRRINQEHRFIYRVRGSRPDQMLEISACRFHYAK